MNRSHKSVGGSSTKLSAERLKQGYNLAPLRVQQYLKAEIDFVRVQIPAHAILLELGCGYGRVLQQLFPYVKTLVGIDTARGSSRLAQVQARVYFNPDGCRPTGVSAPLFRPGD